MNKGGIIIIPFLFTDLSGDKNRPAIGLLPGFTLVGNKVTGNIFFFFFFTGTYVCYKRKKTFQL